MGLDGVLRRTDRNPFEYGAKRRNRGASDLADGYRPTGELVERRHSPVRDAARHDELELIEIGRDVEGESVARDPPGDADADRRELAIADPCAREPRHAVCGNA